MKMKSFQHEKHMIMLICNLNHYISNYQDYNYYKPVLSEQISIFFKIAIMMVL